MDVNKNYVGTTTQIKNISMLIKRVQHTNKGVRLKETHKFKDIFN